MSKTTVVHLQKWQSGSSQQWTKIGARRLFKIKQRATINEHLQWLGFSEPLSLENLREIYTLRRFLGLGRGPSYSHARYFQLKATDSLNCLFLESGINPNSEFEELINDYSQRT